MTDAIPGWVVTISGYSSLISTLIIATCIVLHLYNYRKPFQQRLEIRIQLIVPLFALSCYCMLLNQRSYFNKYVLEPVREVYEAFVIYTFFSLLTLMLGGERNIIIMTSGREPVSHPGLLKYIIPDLDISDSYTFLAIKRGILQYVWLKPVICFSIILSEVLGIYDVNNMGVKSVYLWLTLLYNFSVTLSLYCLAIFWKILWNDLKPFNPVGKFLCVKLIIFASYWQGVLLAILNFMNVLPGAEDDKESNVSIGVSIQNALLCVELIGFAWGHWVSFSYKAFSIRNLPYGRLQFFHAFKDVIGVKDLVHDFQLTFYGDYYKDYKQFDSVEALISHPDSKGRMSRINQGLRYHSDGKQKHWLLPQHNSMNNDSIRSTSELNAIRSTNTPASAKDYASSFKSTGTSTKGLYSSSPKNLTSPPSSPKIQDLDINEPAQLSITDTLNSDNIRYDNELLDEDELYYKHAFSVINNYNLDQGEIKRLLNYPIVDELVDGHVFGYKVKKLREDRENNRSGVYSRGEPLLQKNTNYGSVS